MSGSQDVHVSHRRVAHRVDRDLCRQIAGRLSLREQRKHEVPTAIIGPHRIGESMVPDRVRLFDENRTVRPVAVHPVEQVRHLATNKPAELTGHRLTKFNWNRRHVATLRLRRAPRTAVMAPSNADTRFHGRSAGPGAEVESSSPDDRPAARHRHHRSVLARSGDDHRSTCAPRCRVLCQRPPLSHRSRTASVRRPRTRTNTAEVPRSADCPNRSRLSSEQSGRSVWVRLRRARRRMPRRSLGVI